MHKETDGHKSVRNGQALEGQVNFLLQNSGFKELSEEDKKLLNRGDFTRVVDSNSSSWYVQQVSLDNNLYKAKYKMDFLLYHETEYPQGLNIECKWQSSPGSIDEKYVFTVGSLKSIKRPSLMLLIGDGARAKTIEWITTQEKEGKFTFFTDMTAFTKWCNSHLRQLEK